ncbi:MAG: biopolymer transporter ExbD [Prevotella sp.]|nr:biopolymer transporter ExbD [Prevotella sp.]
MIFRRDDKRHELPALNTSSLPDLIFTVLFFFMIVTTMRSVPVKVSYNTPEGYQLSKFKKKPTTVYVMIGHPVGKKAGSVADDRYVVQVNDKIVKTDQVAAVVAAIKEQLLPDEQDEMTVILKVDEHVPMGIVTDVKMALRKADALKIHYSATNKKLTGDKKTHH